MILLPFILFASVLAADHDHRKEKPSFHDAKRFIKKDLFVGVDREERLRASKGKQQAVLSKSALSGFEIAADRLRNNSVSLTLAAVQALKNANERGKLMQKLIGEVDGVDKNPLIRPGVAATIERHKQKCGGAKMCQIGNGLSRYLALGERRNMSMFNLSSAMKSVDVDAEAVRESLAKVQAAEIRLSTTTFHSTTSTSARATTSPGGLLALSDEDIVEATLKESYRVVPRSVKSPLQTFAEKRREAIERAAREAAQNFDLHNH
jgi:hypothetical protein